MSNIIQNTATTDIAAVNRLSDMTPDELRERAGTWAEAVIDAEEAVWSEKTRADYRYTVERFTGFMDEMSRAGFGADGVTDATIRAYAAWQLSDGVKPASVSTEVSAVCSSYGVAVPDGVRELLRGWRKKEARDAKQAAMGGQEVVKDVRRVAPIRMGDVERWLRTYPPKTAEQWTRAAAVVLGVTATLRVSEIAALRVQDFNPAAKTITVLTSKTSDVAARVSLTESCCAVLAAAIRATGATSGPLFRADPSKHRPVKDGVADDTTHVHANTVRRWIKAAAAEMGLNPDDVSGHSLRRGGLTTLAERGEQLHAIARHARHKNMSVTQSYIDEAEAKTTAAALVMELDLSA